MILAFILELTRQGDKQPGRNATEVSTEISADGNSQLLVISYYNSETSLYKPARRGHGAMRRSDSTDSISTQQYETEPVSAKPNMTISVELEGVGLSVITKSAAELFYLSLRGLNVTYSDYPTYYEGNVDCKWIQIDNQLFGGLFPIILYPTVIPKDGKELESHPTLQTTVAILKDQCMCPCTYLFGADSIAHGVKYIKYATILLQSMTVELDEDFLFALLDFAKFKDAAWREVPAE
jgi:vacuolar protein sorting-associated protein 13A/C